MFLDIRLITILDITEQGKEIRMTRMIRAIKKAINITNMRQKLFKYRKTYS